jgi:protein-disulfide isomerase
MSRSTMTANPRRILIALAVLLAALLAATLAAVRSDTPSGRGAKADAPAKVSTSSSEQAPPDPDVARRKAGDPSAVGRVDAPVVMVEYADFQCPFCGRFARETEPELLRKYVKKGVLRIEWRHFPVFGAESEAAARAGYAAARQKRFWQFHDLAYAKTHQRNSGAFSEDHLVTMARQAGVPDLVRFRRDMKSKDADRAVERDQQEGYRLGVTSTPAFLINGRPILGAQPTAAFEETIEKAEETARK